MFIGLIDNVKGIGREFGLYLVNITNSDRRTVGGSIEEYLPGNLSRVSDLIVIKDGRNYFIFKDTLQLGDRRRYYSRSDIEDIFIAYLERRGKLV